MSAKFLNFQEINYCNAQSDNHTLYLNLLDNPINSWFKWGQLPFRYSPVIGRHFISSSLHSPLMTWSLQLLRMFMKLREIGHKCAKAVTSFNLDNLDDQKRSALRHTTGWSELLTFLCSVYIQVHWRYDVTRGGSV